MKKVISFVLFLTFIISNMLINSTAYAALNSEIAVVEGVKYTTYGLTGRPESNYTIVTGYTSDIGERVQIHAHYRGNTIASGAFRDCTKIKYLYIDSGITNIESGAFSRCTNLEKVSFKGPRESLFLDKNAFIGCYNLKEIDFLNPPHIGTKIFSGSAILNISDNAFSGCTSLDRIFYESDKMEYNSINQTIGNGNEAYNNAEIFFVGDVRGVSLNKTSINMVKGNKAVIQEEIYPSDALNKNVSWSSSDISVATVSEGVISAVGVGEAIITVTTDDRGQTAECKVRVTENTTSVLLGDGSEENPYQISTEQELEAISDIPNASYILMNDIYLSKPFVPLCLENGEYSGVFDGNGHTISNVTISSPYQYSGLFAKSSGIIKNLNVEYSKTGAAYELTDRNIDDESSPGFFFGGIVAHNSGYIVGCNVNIICDIKYNNTYSCYGYIGGISGYNGDSSKILNCSVKGNINCRCIYAIIGGAAGSMTQGDIDSVSSDITMYMGYDSDLNNYSVGGVVGSSSNVIIKNINVKYDIEFPHTLNGLKFGGVAGVNRGTISNVVAVGKIKDAQTIKNNRALVGGICGIGSIVTNATADFTANLYSYSKYYNGYYDTTAYCGGIAGDAKVYNSYAQISICCNGYTSVGGIVGSGIVSDSYAIGTIGTIDSTNRKTAQGIGGLNVTNSYAVVSGVGSGITCGVESDVTNYNTSIVVSNSFYDKNVAECENNNYGTPLTTIGMKSKTLYTNAGWDFDNVWDINPLFNDGYPYLRALYDNPVISVEGICLSESSITLDVGESAILTAQILPQDATNKKFYWKSSDENIVTVSDGEIYTKNYGTAYIIVTTDERQYQAVCEVNVKDKRIVDTDVHVNGISLDTNSVNMGVDEYNILHATILPSNASNQNIIWRSSNENVAFVHDGMICSVGSGNTTITAMSVDGRYTASCNVNVVENIVSSPTASITETNVDKGTAVSLSTATSGAEIYYTTDGSEPSVSSEKYVMPIIINDNTTIKAIAVKTGLENSTISTFVYTIIVDERTTISVSDETAKAGDTVDVAIDLSKNDNIAGMLLKLSYDSVLELKNIRQGDALDTLTFTPPANLSKNNITLLWDGVAGDSSNGNILILTFDVKDTAEKGVYNISLNYTPGDIYDNDFNDVDVKIINGTVTVIDYMLGDVNGDNVINAKDITLLRRYISGDYGVTVENNVADVNRDKAINAKDITLLRRYISGDYGVTLD